MRIPGWVVAFGLLQAIPALMLAPVTAQAATESASQPGTVKSYSNGVLTITPYNSQSNLTEFQLDPSAPIRQGTGRITAAGLAPGTNVRVDYTANTGQLAKATTVQVLPQDQVAGVKSLAQSEAPHMALGSATASTTGTLDNQQKDALIKGASGSQPGKIVSSDSSNLVLDPYQKAAGNATLRMTPSTVVFQANNKVDTNSLHPGTDVRVYYKNVSGQKPEVVAVELLNSTDAQQLEKTQRNMPKKNP